MTTGDYGQPQQGQPQPQYGAPTPGGPQYGQPPQAPGGPQYGPPAPGPQYGQSPYGGYGPPGGGYGPSAGPARQSFGVVGAALAVVGAVAVVLALTTFKWFDSGDSKFSDVHKVLDSAPSSAVAGLADAYFGWLAWAMLAAAVVIAVAANAPSGAAAALRTVGALLGLAAAVVTLFAIKLDATGAQGFSDYLKHARLAFYVAMAGFVVIGIGAAIGPRRT